MNRFLLGPRRLGALSLSGRPVLLLVFVIPFVVAAATTAAPAPPKPPRTCVRCRPTIPTPAFSRLSTAAVRRFASRREPTTRTRTIVDGGGAGSVFTIRGDATLTGLTIQNGDYGIGGGIFNNGTLTLNNSLVTGNTPDDTEGF